MIKETNNDNKDVYCNNYSFCIISLMVSDMIRAILIVFDFVKQQYTFVCMSLPSFTIIQNKIYDSQMCND